MNGLNFDYDLAMIGEVILHWFMRFGLILGGSCLMCTVVIAGSSHLVIEIAQSFWGYPLLARYALACGFAVLCLLMFVTRGWWISEAVTEWDHQGAHHANVMAILRKRASIKKTLK